MVQNSLRVPVSQPENDKVTAIAEKWSAKFGSTQTDFTQCVVECGLMSAGAFEASGSVGDLECGVEEEKMEHKDHKEEVPGGTEIFVNCIGVGDEVCARDPGEVPGALPFPLSLPASNSVLWLEGGCADVIPTVLQIEGGSADARSDAPSPKSFLSQQSFFPPAHPILSKENAQLVVMGAAGAHLGIGHQGGEIWNPEEPDSHPFRRPRPSPPESDDSNIFQCKDHHDGCAFSLCTGADH